MRSRPAVSGPDPSCKKPFPQYIFREWEIVSSIGKEGKRMNCRSILSGLVGLWGIVSSGGEPAAPAPEFEAVAEAKLRQQIGVIDRQTAAQRMVIEAQGIAQKRSIEGYTYQDERGFDAAEKVRSVGKTAYVPMWGEKIVWKKDGCK